MYATCPLAPMHMHALTCTITLTQDIFLITHHSRDHNQFIIKDFVHHGFVCYGSYIFFPNLRTSSSINTRVDIYTYAYLYTYYVILTKDCMRIVCYPHERLHENSITYI